MVLSEDLVLFPELSTPCLELCSVTTSPRETGSTNSDYAPPANLRIVRTLTLPIFHPNLPHAYGIHADGWLLLMPARPGSSSAAVTAARTRTITPDVS